MPAPIKRYSKNGRFNLEEIQALMLTNPTRRTVRKISAANMKAGIADAVRANEAKKKEAESPPVPKQLLR